MMAAWLHEQQANSLNEMPSGGSTNCGGWKARGWKTAAKEPVKNVDLWKRLDEAIRTHHIRWGWVKGHSGHDGNERADALANKGVDSLRCG